MDGDCNFDENIDNQCKADSIKQDNSFYTENNATETIQISFKKTSEEETKSSLKDEEITLKRNKAKAIVQELIRKLKANPNDPNLRLDCPQCDTKQLRKYVMYNHLMRVHEEEKEMCKYCGVYFKIGYLKHHIEHRHGSKKKPVKERKKMKLPPSKERVRSMVEHMINELKADPKDPNLRLDCPLCDSKQLKKQIMYNHLLRVHDEEKELCTYCGVYFKRMYLSNHIKNKHENENEKFVCVDCGKDYASKYGLMHHIEVVHQNKEKEVCPFCAKEYRNLQRHIEIAHEGKKPKEYPCKVPGCSKKYFSSTHLDKHFNNFHLNKKEECPQCGILVKNMKEHHRLSHLKVQKCVCPQCDKPFNSHKNMKLHVERVHNMRRYTCPHCNMSVSKIREHLKKTHKITDFNIDDIEVQRMHSN